MSVRLPGIWTQSSAEGLYCQISQAKLTPHTWVSDPAEMRASAPGICFHDVAILRTLPFQC